MSVPFVPIDLLFLVIDQLHHDLDTLKACSLACKALLYITRPHIFGNLTIQAEVRSFEDFHKFLLDKPHIHRYIQVLTLSGWPKFISYLHGVKHTIKISTSLLLDIVSLLPHLHSFELSLLSLEPAPPTPHAPLPPSCLTSLTFTACNTIAVIDYLHILRLF
jgi:hypothetical protein